ncbi:MAG: chemotaxis protein CheW [Desulfobacter sp.]|nr:MAG: chemotaxis protein CheW [Desulfobacter sp.]
MDTGKTSDTGMLPVKVELLNTLMDLAGELVLGRNQMLQGIGRQDMKSIEAAGHRIDMITSEFQEVVMKTRMQSVAGLFRGLKNRAVETAAALDMSVEVSTRGEEVELDTAILDGIRIPLEALTEYCIRFLLDSADQRAEAGKPSSPGLVLKASNEAGQIVVSLADDGCGRFSQPLPEAAEAEIESIGGRIETDSRSGVGSEIRVKLPLTLAIIPSQIASVGREKYAIPQANLEELIRIPANQVKERIEKVGAADVVRLRGELLPVLNLSEMLGIPRYYIDPGTGDPRRERRRNIADRRSLKRPEEGEPFVSGPEDAQEFTERGARDRRRHPSSALNIAVVFAGSYRYGLVIDTLHDAEEIVVKPLGRHLKHYRAWAGATIMGDGNVALILDILNLAQMGGLALRREGDSTSGKNEAVSGKNAVVVFKNGESEYFAVPFDSVARIERVRTTAIEVVGNRKVTQYRGGSLPLYELSGMVNVAPLPQREVHEVIVFREGDMEFGLMATPPVDTVETELVLDEGALKQKGVKGTVIINGRTTLLIDVKVMAGYFLPKLE